MNISGALLNMETKLNLNHNCFSYNIFTIAIW